MRICYFGIFDINYNRNKVLISGLKENGVDVIICKSYKKGILKYFDLIIKHWKIRDMYDIMIVGFPGHQCVLLSKLLSRKTIIFDAFISLYDSLVFDRKEVKKRSFKANYYFLLDLFACKLADRILLDTNEHIKYFVNTFKIDINKFIRVFVGAEIQYKKNQIKNNDKFLVHFHGNDIPLQGVDTIIQAANLLNEENIQFNIIGVSVKDRPSSSNINFFCKMPYGQLMDKMAAADICLGIFGGTDKSNRVIPNKVFEALSMAKPIVTGMSLAAKELLIDRYNVLFCDMANPDDLAEKIRLLKNNKELRELIAQNGFSLYNQKLEPKFIVKSFLNQI